MDIRTGLVGVSSPVSNGGLAVRLAWRPPRGSKREAFLPSPKVIRGLIDELVRVGLVKRYSLQSKDEMRLQVLLVLADRALARPQEDGQMMGKGTPPSGSHASAGFAPDDGQMMGNEDRQISVNRGKNPLSDLAAADAPPVVNGAREAGAALPREVALCKLLRAEGIEATPALMRRAEVLALVDRSNADWLAAAATALQRKPGERVGVMYLLPIMREIAKTAGNVVRLHAGRSGSGQRAGRFNPGAHLDSLFGGRDDDCIVGSAQRVD